MGVCGQLECRSPPKLISFQTANDQDLYNPQWPSSLTTVPHPSAYVAELVPFFSWLPGYNCKGGHLVTYLLLPMTCHSLDKVLLVWAGWCQTPDVWHDEPRDPGLADCGGSHHQVLPQAGASPGQHQSTVSFCHLAIFPTICLLLTCLSGQYLQQECFAVRTCCRSRMYVTYVCMHVAYVCRYEVYYACLPCTIW